MSSPSSFAGRTAVVLALALVAAGCHDKPLPRVKGTTLIAGKVRGLWVAPGGAAAATLVGAGPSNVKGAPSDLLLGSLTLTAVAGGAPRRLGGAVSNLPGSVLFTPDGQYLGFIAGYDVRSAMGELRLAKVSGGPPEVVAPRVTFFAFSPGGDQLAYVSDGDLFLRPAAQGPARRIASSVSLVEFGPPETPAAQTLFVHRTVRVDGALLSYDLSKGQLTAIARGVERFRFSPAGDALAFVAAGLLAPGQVEAPSIFGDKKPSTPEAPGLYVRWGSGKPERLVADGAGEFRFSPVGHRLAYVTQPKGMATTGDLWVVDEHAAPRKVAIHVEQLVFGADGSLALLGAYLPSAEAGTLGILPREGALFEVARSVRQFSVTPQGHELLFLHGVMVGTSYALALSERPLGAPEAVKPREIDDGVAGYTVDQTEKHLAYKARCLAAGRSCSLFVVDLTRPGPPVLVATHIAAFQFVPGEDQLVVVESRPAGKLSGKLLYSLALAPGELPAGKPAPPLQLLDDDMTGDFALAGQDQREVVYLVDEAGRTGLARAALPKLPSARR